MRRAALFAAVSLLLGMFGGCTVSQVQRSVNVASKLPDMDAQGAVRLLASQDPILGRYLQVEALFRKDLTRFVKAVSRKWEREPKVATAKKYVKYSQNYTSRAEVDFEQRHIIVETVDTDTPKKSLKKAIRSTLLTPYDPENIDLLSDKEVKLGGEPFLYGQVLDAENRPLRWAWRTNRYAEYLLEHHYKQKRIRTSGGSKTVCYVTIPMQKNAASLQVEKLRPHVFKNAKRFDLSPALIYAVIETESSFNPYAASSVPAYGLMQIVPKTAGRDVWRYLNKKDAIPSKRYLYNERNNIEMGSAYLHIIDTKYLKSIQNPRTREYCTIAAYNTGSGNVLKTFHSSDRRKAVRVINAMTADEVFARLRSSLPYEETRRYIEKATTAKKRYTAI